MLHTDALAERAQPWRSKSTRRDKHQNDMHTITSPSHGTQKKLLRSAESAHSLQSTVIPWQLVTTERSQILKVSGFVHRRRDQMLSARAIRQP
jgi:hypothetical protein